MVRERERWERGRGGERDGREEEVVRERSEGHSVSTQPIFAKVPRCPSPILPKKFLKLLWLV